MAASFLPLASHKSLVSSAPPLHILLVDMDRGRGKDIGKVLVRLLGPGKARREKAQQLSSQPVQQSRGVTPAGNEKENMH